MRRVLTFSRPALLLFLLPANSIPRQKKEDEEESFATSYPEIPPRYPLTIIRVRTQLDEFEFPIINMYVCLWERDIKKEERITGNKKT